MAYALQNAIEHKKADAERVMPKLFQHGLKKNQIEQVMPKINEIVKSVNDMKPEEREKKFKEYKKVVKKREEKSNELPELPKSEVKGKVTLRIAPFPSGALHIGNAKTMLLNALYAERYKGKLYLVYDDTIGSQEKQPVKESYDLIKEAFDILGVQYDDVVYKSDRLKIYYEHAVKLIKKKKAYVCHCSIDEVRDNRSKGVECGCRYFPYGLQLERWKEMFKLDEGHATLRLKTDMMHKNPAFRDRVLFKISDRKHPRVGNKYRVWPTLEMTWAVDDHLLGVTHIIRGNELMMETEVEKYIWDIFGWKHPQTIHTGLVKISGVEGKISKSKSQKEVMSGKYFGWDDPRTWSIQSLHKRGITGLAIKQFVKEIGLNKRNLTVPIDSLYSLNRKIMDLYANRYNFVWNPIKIDVKNSEGEREIKVPLHPDKEDKRSVPVGNVFYVTKDDFDKNKRKEVRLINLFNIKMKEKTKTTSVENRKVPKVHWVSKPVEARVLMPEGNWIEGFADAGIKDISEREIIQFERFGFCRYSGMNKGKHEFWFGHK